MWQRILQYISKTRYCLLCLVYITLLFLLGFVTSGLMVLQGAGIVGWVNSLSQNMVEMLGVVISVGMTGIAALAGVGVALWQLRIQFEHKVIYEAWVDFQKHLFSFSSALIDFQSKVMWLKYSVRSQNNPLVNGGNIERFWNQKQAEVFQSYQNLMHASVLLLQSFETHEVIFLELRDMKNIFNQQCQDLIFQKYQHFQEVIFPAMAGMETFSVDEKLDFIDSYGGDMYAVIAYLEDFRVELQNETIGKILNREVPRRQPLEAGKILTKRGLKDFIPEPGQSSHNG